MNYRHAYHAGNHGDVLKHATLVEILRLLQEKPAPLFLLDTHAGIGQYDLEGIEAGKTEEWQAGIGKVIAANPESLARYLELIRAINPDGGTKFYPGSPAIAAASMRDGDRLVLCELHPEDANTLRGWARFRRGVSVHLRDGYEAIGAFLPPTEKRGLVIVDPPYETTTEIGDLTAAVLSGIQRWRGGRWMIWHPIKDRAQIWRLTDAILAGGVTNLLAAELLVRPEDGMSLAGSGLILINPPFGLENWLRVALPGLLAILAPQHGSYALRWLGG